MIDRGALKVAAAVLLAVCGCGGGGPKGPATPSMGIHYPVGFPYTGTAPAGANWYFVAGVRPGEVYVAGIEVQQPGPNIELDVYDALQATPANELCIAAADTFVKSCQLTAATDTVYLLLLNKGATPPSGGFADGPGTFTLSLTGP